MEILKEVFFSQLIISRPFLLVTIKNLFSSKKGLFLFEPYLTRDYPIRKRIIVASEQWKKISHTECLRAQWHRERGIKCLKNKKQEKIIEFIYLSTDQGFRVGGFFGLLKTWLRLRLWELEESRVYSQGQLWNLRCRVDSRLLRLSALDFD